MSDITKNQNTLLAVLCFQEINSSLISENLKLDPRIDTIAHFIKIVREQQHEATKREVSNVYNEQGYLCEETIKDIKMPDFEIKEEK